MAPGKQAGRGRVADSIQPRRRRRAVGWSARSRRGGGMQLGAQPSPSAASPRAKPHWSSPSAGRHTPPGGRPASRGSRPTITACATTPRSPTRPRRLRGGRGGVASGRPLAVTGLRKCGNFNPVTDLPRVQPPARQRTRDVGHAPPPAAETTLAGSIPDDRVDFSGASV